MSHLHPSTTRVLALRSSSIRTPIGSSARRWQSNGASGTGDSQMGRMRRDIVVFCLGVTIGSFGLLELHEIRCRPHRDYMTELATKSDAMADELVERLSQLEKFLRGEIDKDTYGRWLEAHRSAERVSTKEGGTAFTYPEE